MRRLAAFDLDGTLARRDTVLPFLARVAGRPAAGAAPAPEAAALWRMRAGGADRDAAKTAVLARVLTGRDHAALCEHGVRFADDLLRSGLRPDVLDRVRAHQARDDEIVLVTAALDVYAAPLGRRLGMDVLATRLAVDDQGRCTGGIDGANCRGDEKVRRLRQHLDGADAHLWAYGNSREDAPMLTFADHGVWVDRRPLDPLEPLAD